ncbi:amino acid adenylation domain-containing protein [Pseudonocardiaceae bacterium YIM PH 21723]|nr:amino acid adenylation domain-containing protein [Pseudonocardiaceae bacterium YIM PH 21723]
MAALPSPTEEDSKSGVGFPGLTFSRHVGVFTDPRRMECAQRIPHTHPAYYGDNVTEVDSLAYYVDEDILRQTRSGELARVTSLASYFELSCDRSPHAVAVICEDEQLTYQELDQRANRLAHLLRSRGIGSGHTVGILLDRSADTYIALLGVLKSGAAYVPFDPSFPADRIAYIARDAELCAILTSVALCGQTIDSECPSLVFDELNKDLTAQPSSRPQIAIAPADLCYVIYTSGTTGKPKGVAISQANIVNFLRVVTPVYQIRRLDRVYQGLSIAFDFSIEEIWPAWIAGATLIAGPSDGRRVGRELTEFLAQQHVSVLACVPTLLTTIGADLPDLRTLLVSGEACPPDLVRTWARDGRRIINAYGPTEATVTCTVAELYPNRPVTIGAPLPSYTIHILDDRLRPVADGTSGEICIGGPGVAIGYLNRPELTAQKFVEVDGERLYRSGDLGRFTPAGEIEYQGRIDTQVKVRGYRIELGEIEEAIREDPVVTQAVVTLVGDGLVGYVTVNREDEEFRPRLHAALRKRLPGYMIPAHVEILDELPLLAADKVDRGRLPAPVSPPLGRSTGQRIEPATPLEKQLAAVWAEILGGGEPSVTEDFFCDLGGHSLTAARLVSRLREQPEFQGLSMADLYANPTIRGLATFLESTVRQPVEPEDGPEPIRHSSARVWACGAAQLVTLWSWLLVMGLPAVLLMYRMLGELDIQALDLPDGGLFGWLLTMPITGFAGLWLGLTVVTMLSLPILGCRLLMIGLRPGWYRLWGTRYLQIWLYGKVIGLAPLPLLAGSPLLAPYLRALGARIGSRCHLAAPILLPPWVRIGDDTSLGYGTRLNASYVEGGWIRLAPITIGSRVHVGTNSLVLAGAVVEDDASVGEQSLIAAGQTVPAGQYWAGSPSRHVPEGSALLDQLTARADDRHHPWWLLIGYALGAVFMMLVPLIILAPTVVVIAWLAHSEGGLLSSLWSVVIGGPAVALTTCLLVIVVKRLVLWSAKAGIHPERSVFGLRKWLADAMMTTSLNITQALYSTLYLVPFLRGLGAKTGRWSEVATVSFVDPDMMVIGAESFVADVSVVGPAVFHRGRIALHKAEVGTRTFVGNGALVPGSAVLGDDSLIGVHSVAPVRPVEPDTTWLGSPPIFFPRRQQSQSFDERYTFAPAKRLIAARLLIEYFRVTLPATVGSLSTALGVAATAGLAIICPPWVLLLLSPLLFLGVGLAATLLAALLKWIVIGRYRQRTEPLWSVWVRRTELITGLYENMVVPLFGNLVTGTPFWPVVLRLFGARIGRRVWLQTTYLTEFDLVRVGDDAAVGEFTSLQTHLFEDRVMKMSTVTVGRGASIGARSVVLYDASAGPGTSVDAMSLVMKGESLPADTRWRGIPARPR